MDNETMRSKVKILKAIGQIDTYIELSDMLDMKTKSFYNWLRGEYNLGDKKARELKCIIDDLWLPIDYDK